MPAHPSRSASPANGLTPDHGDHLRLLSRSPHPYHRQKRDLLSPSARLSPTANGPAASRVFTKESSPTSDSGTEADDEHFLKGLPAPKARLHKGLRGKDEALSGSSTPLMAPEVLDERNSGIPPAPKQNAFDKDRRGRGDRNRRRREVIRRSTETLLLASMGGIICFSPDVRLVVRLWRKGLLTTYPSKARFLIRNRVPCPDRTRRNSATPLSSPAIAVGVPTSNPFEMGPNIDPAVLRSGTSPLPASGTAVCVASHRSEDVGQVHLAQPDIEHMLSAQSLDPRIATWGPVQPGPLDVVIYPDASCRKRHFPDRLGNELYGLVYNPRHRFHALSSSSNSVRHPPPSHDHQSPSSRTPATLRFSGGPTPAVIVTPSGHIESCAVGYRRRDPGDM